MSEYTLIEHLLCALPVLRAFTHLVFRHPCKAKVMFSFIRIRGSLRAEVNFPKVTWQKEGRKISNPCVKTSDSMSSLPPHKLVNKLVLDGSGWGGEAGWGNLITWWESFFLFNSLSNILINQVENIFGIQMALAHVEGLLTPLTNRAGLRLGTFNTQQSLTRI